jgi:hypothetical protein
MKRWQLSLLILIVVVLSAAGLRYLWGKRASQKRELAYQSALLQYQQSFRPGMTRKDVEDHLRSENVEFRQMCCVEGNLPKGVYDDLAKIGQEDAPWYCSEENVYVAFQFTGPRRNAIGWTADASDKLSAVTIFRWLEGCL